MYVRNNKTIDSINKEILVIEELILACLLKNKNSIDETMNVLEYISATSIFLKSIFAKMFYLQQTNMNCNY